MTTKQWVWIVFGILYLLPPIDIIPDFVPVLGNLDDAGVMAFVIKKVFESA